MSTDAHGSGAQPMATRRKATIRFSDPQWDRLHAYCFEQKTTVQAVIIAALAAKIDRFTL